MTPPLSLDFVTEKMKEYGTVEQVRRNRIRITTTPDKVFNAIKNVLGPLGCDRLVTISTVDNGHDIRTYLPLHRAPPDCGICRDRSPA